MENYQGFVYEWVNTINGMKYIGSHIGKDSDKYLGSGVNFRADLKKYGTQSFTRKILEYVNDANDLPAIEKKYLELVDAKDNPNYYNKTNGSSASKKPKELKERDLCVKCLKALQAVNYIDPDGRTHYRTMCTSCIHKNKKTKQAAPAWFKIGYRKKPTCEKCGFKAKYPEDQLRVFYLDGNLRNNSWPNLKTICLNCQQEIIKSRLSWKPADIVPDF